MNSSIGSRDLNSYNRFKERNFKLDCIRHATFLKVAGRVRASDLKKQARMLDPLDSQVLSPQQISLLNRSQDKLSSRVSPLLATDYGMPQLSAKAAPRKKPKQDSPSYYQSRSKLLKLINSVRKTIKRSQN